MRGNSLRECVADIRKKANEGEKSGIIFSNARNFFKSLIHYTSVLVQKYVVQVDDPLVQIHEIVTKSKGLGI